MSDGRGGRRGRWVVGVPMAVVGLLLGPVLMAPVYAELAPRLGAMTLLVVELLFAFLIDIPLAGTFVALVTALGLPVRDPARLAVGFTALFFGAIGVCVALSPVHPALAWLGLADTFRPAVGESVRVLGPIVQGVLLLCFLAFDLLLCAAAGIAGGRLAAGGGGSST